MRVLSWNLFHGRSVPGSGRDLLPDFAARIAAWDWDVAFLQEVPPWWGEPLGRACGASARVALTSRNLGLPVRRAVAERFPDLIKSGGGGANAILVRGQAIQEHHRATLRLWPERRVAHAVRTADGSWWANLHATAHREDRAVPDGRKAGAAALAWAGPDARIVLGGDMNVRTSAVPGYTHLVGNWVDHLHARGWKRRSARLLERGPLSDHAPVLLELAD